MKRGIEDAKKLADCIISNTLMKYLNDLNILMSELVNDNISIEFKYKLLKCLFKKYNFDISDINLEQFDDYLIDFFRVNYLILVYSQLQLKQ